MTRIKLLKSWGPRRKGEILTVDAARAAKLIAEKRARLHPPPAKEKEH